MTDNNVFEIQNLSFAYDKNAQILKDISVCVPRGKITAVIGANGCGKSTLFRLLCGLLKPTSGKVLFEGTELGKIRQKKLATEISIVHQSNTAPDDISVKKLVSLGRTPYHNLFSGALTDEDREVINQALAITDTQKFSEKAVSELSGGQRQRVWLAMALAQDTKVLLLDEITTYLDIYYQIQLLRLVYDLNRKNDITVLMILHDINQAIEYSDNTIIMNQGKISASGPTKQIITEERLLQAFRVKTKIESIDNKEICIYR